MPLISALLKEILCCPCCKGDLEEDEPQARLRCTGCGLAFPVQDGIPVMLIDEADKPEGFDATVCEKVSGEKIAGKQEAA